MHCEQVRERLGRFHDGELEPAEQTVLASHLCDCSACANELAAIAELGELFRSLAAPAPPALLWSRIERRLEARRPVWKALVIAALIVMAVATGWLAHRQPQVPDLVVEGLGAARPVSLQEAARQVDFRLVSQTDLAGGYRLDECCLCNDQSCELVRCKYRRGADRVVLVQGPPDRPADFGDRPATETTVAGKRVRVVQCDGCLAATWRTRETTFGLIGPRDLTELVRLLASVDDKP